MELFLLLMVQGMAFGHNDIHLTIQNTGVKCNTDKKNIANVGIR